MNHFDCPHIDGNLEAQRRRSEARRLLRERVLAKVRTARMNELTPEERGWLEAEIAIGGPGV